MAIQDDFPRLEAVLEDSSSGISIAGRKFISETEQPKRPIPLLRHYMVDDSIQEVVKHNLRWANGNEEKPQFKFAYMMLPTSCNQRCMGCFTGQDKSRLQAGLDGEFYSDKTLDEVVGFLKDHGTEAIVYGGGGELFTWKGAFDYLDRIIDSGLGAVIFTNGTLLQEQNIERLASKDVSLIISLRDTVEAEHDQAVRVKGFRKTLRALDYALQKGMHEQNKLAVEIPVTKNNEERVIYDFVPAMRSLGVIPFPEEYIQIMTSDEERRVCHDFREAREFFIKMAEIDRKLGYHHEPVFGQRMHAQPKCERPLYSFAIYPSGGVMDCPSHSVNYGNFLETSLKKVVYTGFRDKIRNFQLCPCSVFYTATDKEIPIELPKHLEVFR
jgi:MoaA/NifB/PqqE/SkfB family radical SAM enzyme